MKTNNKDVNKYINSLLKFGWSFVGRGNHPMLLSPKGRKIFVSSTPRDQGYLRVLKGRVNRALKN